MASWQTVARQAAQRHGVDPNVFVAQIRQESGGRDVTSGAGAQGPAQFIPGTARQYGLNDQTVHQLGPSLDAAARLMADNLRKYGNYKRALSAYNSGRPDAYQDPNFADGQTYNYVKTILGSAGGSPSPASNRASNSPGGTSRTVTTTTPGVDNSQTRRALIGNFLSQGGVKSSTATAALAQGWQGAQDVPGTTSTRTLMTAGSPSTSTRTSGTSSDTSVYKQRADAIDANHLPYAWGGGHSGHVTAATPVDCSGAVSEVLGINPRVASEFEKWGKPGEGGNVTIYANPDHVIMKIRDPKTGSWHFFGTSASNPGGGAGWIKQSYISPEYLRGFTARHQ